MKMGLLDPARELLALHQAEVGGAERFIRQSEKLIEESLHAQVGWPTYQRRFLRNLEALTSKYPTLAAWIQPWESTASQFSLYRLPDGNFQIAQKRPGRPCRWWPSLSDHRDEQLRRPFAHDAKAIMPAPYLFHGLGHGWFIRRLFDATQHTFLTFSPAIYIVESDPLAMVMSLHLHDWQEILCDPRVYVIFGDSIHRDLERLWGRDDGLPLPGVCVQNSLCPDACTKELVQTIKRAADRRRRLQIRSARQTDNSYRKLDVHYWAKRFSTSLSGRNSPLRIMAPVSRQTSYLQYCIRDSADALASLGHSCQVLTEPSDHHLVSIQATHRALCEHQVDMLLVLDHLRTGSLRAMPRALPIFTWDQDLLPQCMTRDNIRNMGSLDLLAGASKYHYISRLGCDPGRICFTIIPTNPKTFSNEAISPTEHEHYHCDVSYVSTASQPPEAFHQEERHRVTNPHFRHLMDRMYLLTRDAMADGRDILGGAGHWILSEAENTTGVNVTDAAQRDRLIKWYLWRLTDRFYRHQALEWVANWAMETGRAFHLYGQGWELHKTLGRFARGVAKNGHELRCIYQASRINLQLMPAGFIHQRALDGLAAGGFFLTRHTSANHLSLKAARILDRFHSELNPTQQAGGHSASLRALLDDYEAAAGVRYDPARPDDLLYLRCTAEHDAAAGVFQEFDKIEFGSEQDFVEQAERYLNSSDERNSIVHSMRRVVMERYTYETTMNRFLNFAKDYFVAKAEGSEALSGTEVDHVR